jgi:hypothetical protein
VVELKGQEVAGHKQLMMQQHTSAQQGFEGHVCCCKDQVKEGVHTTVVHHSFVGNQGMICWSIMPTSSRQSWLHVPQVSTGNMREHNTPF